MCELKPGPRCSNDTKKSFQRASNNVKKIEKFYVKAQQRVVSASNDFRRNADKETEAELGRAERSLARVADELKAAEAKKADKQLHYFATPKGLQWLEQQQSTSPEAGRLLKTATDFRTTQKYLLTKLEQAVSLEKKRIFIQTAKQVITRNMAVKEQKLNIEKDRALLDEYEARTSLDYSRLLLEDLNDAERNLKPRKEPVAGTSLIKLPTEQKVALLGGMLHENWRHERLQADGTYEPRIKSTSDQTWISKHSTDQVDIANTDYSELPEDWQKENKAAADFIVKEFVEKGHVINMSDKKAVEEVGDKIHTAWLSRNAWAKGSELDVPFRDLSTEEKDKDIAQYKIALVSFFGK